MHFCERVSTNIHVHVHICSCTSMVAIIVEYHTCTCRLSYFGGIDIIWRNRLYTIITLSCTPIAYVYCILCVPETNSQLANCFPFKRSAKAMHLRMQICLNCSYTFGAVVYTKTGYIGITHAQAFSLRSILARGSCKGRSLLRVQSIAVVIFRPHQRNVIYLTLWARGLYSYTFSI